MAAFITTDELANHLRVSVSDTDAAEQYAESACAIVRDYLGQLLDRKRGDVYTAYGDGSELFQLPELPVTAVSAVSIWNVPLTSAEWSWSPRGELYRVLVADQSVASWVGSWPLNVPVAVTYDHGYVTVPQTIKSVALELAGQLYMNPVGAVQSETVAGYSVTYAVSTAVSAGRMGLTQDMRDRLRPYKPVEL